MRLIPMYWVRALGGVALHRGHDPLRRATSLMTWRRAAGALRGAGARGRRALRPMEAVARRAAGGFPAAAWHRRWEGLPLTFTVWVGGRGGRRVALRDRADVPDRLERADHRVGASRTRRSSWPAATSTSAEGCFNCHSQMIRPIRAETMRYGEYSQAGRVRLRPSVPLGLAAHRSGPARGWAASTPTSGTCGTWRTRARPRRSRSCRPTRGSRAPRSSGPRSSAAWRRR